MAERKNKRKGVFEYPGGTAVPAECHKIKRAAHQLLKEEKEVQTEEKEDLDFLIPACFALAIQLKRLRDFKHPEPRMFSTEEWEAMCKEYERHFFLGDTDPLKLYDALKQITAFVDWFLEAICQASQHAAAQPGRKFQASVVLGLSTFDMILGKPTNLFGGEWLHATSYGSEFGSPGRFQDKIYLEAYTKKGIMASLKDARKTMRKHLAELHKQGDHYVFSACVGPGIASQGGVLIHPGTYAECDMTNVLARHQTEVGKILKANPWFHSYRFVSGSPAMSENGGCLGEFGIATV